MNFFSILSVLFAPALIFLLIIYLRYRFEIKTLQNIYQAIFWGIFPVVFVIIVHSLFKIIDFHQTGSIKRMLIYVFFAIAFSAEFGKFIPIRFSLFHLKTFDGPLSGIIYSLFVSLSFATFAVLLNLLGFFGNLMGSNLVLFLWTYPIANLFFGTVLGFFIGMQRIKRTALVDEVTGVAIATGLHLVYYFSLLAHDLFLFLVTSLGLIIVSFFLLRKAISLPIRSL